ncbi:MAG: phage tail protein [Anaerolineales bacterium]|nr:phage tail protein [Anaerolineales bacterium]
MSEPFLAEIRMVGFNFAPRGWAFCDGQVLQIMQNQSLYSLLGTTYGGDGRTTFALPDLRGRTPIHVGQSDSGHFHNLGERGGEENHTLIGTEMPSHTHSLLASTTTADSPIAASQVMAATDAVNIYDDSSNNLVNMNSSEITSTGGSQAHNNMMPTLVVNFCIALQGLFPSRN